MKKIFITTMAVLALFATIACNGSKTPSVPDNTPADALRTSADKNAIATLSSSTWTTVFANTGTDATTYTLTFDAGGTMTVKDPDGAAPSEDTLNFTRFNVVNGYYYFGYSADENANKPSFSYSTTAEEGKLSVIGIIDTSDTPVAFEPVGNVNGKIGTWTYTNTSSTSGGEGTITNKYFLVISSDALDLIREQTFQEKAEAQMSSFTYSAETVSTTEGYKTIEGTPTARYFGGKGSIDGDTATFELDSSTVTFTKVK